MVSVHKRFVESETSSSRGSAMPQAIPGAAAVSCSTGGTSLASTTSLSTYEYDCLLGPLLIRLARRDNLADLSEYPWYAVQDHFGLDPVQMQNRRFRRPSPGMVRSQEPEVLAVSEHPLLHVMRYVGIIESPAGRGLL
jgi:hypothetical protein